MKVELQKDYFWICPKCGKKNIIKDHKETTCQQCNNKIEGFKEHYEGDM